MTMIVCRKRGYVSPRVCAVCKIPEDRKIAKGKVQHDRGPYKGDTVPVGSCPWFVKSIETCLSVDSPFERRVVDQPFRKRYRKDELKYLDL